MASPPDSEPAWPSQLYELLRASGYVQFPYVPDSGLRRLIELATADPAATALPLANEGEGVGVVTGCYLGGSRGVLLMQSGGVGNCVNQLSLVRHCAVPFLGIVSMRGEWGEQNPWQYPMGQATPRVLEAMGVQTMTVRQADEVVPTAEAAVGAVERAGRAIAILLSQRLLGVKTF